MNPGYNEQKWLVPRCSFQPSLILGYRCLSKVKKCYAKQSTNQCQKYKVIVNSLKYI